MADPILAQTWYTRAEILFPDSTNILSATRSFLITLKQFLIGAQAGGSLGASGAPPAGSFWTVEGSSNGTVAGMDGVDRWGTTLTNLVRAAEGVAHSWIVLKSPDAMGPVYLLINNNGAVDGQWSYTFARNAYTGGSTTAKPTSTSEINPFAASVTSTYTGIVDTTFGVNWRAHFVVNANGEFFFFTNRAGTALVNGCVMLCNLRDQLAADPWPTIMHASSSASSSRGTPTTALMTSTTNTAMRQAVATTRFAGVLSSYTFGGATFGGAMTIDVLSGNPNKFVTLPVSAMDCTNAANQSFRGNLQDVWTVGAVPIGSSYPTAATQTQQVFGDYLFPCGVSLAL